ncbi:MAG TPA: metallopeptidase TldD-related protein [Gemmatimonadaceae bacterium]|jgi:predicted Zn-dependent protease|nr:metallopeptidase TldD-related protein [Gemmatimonadaceae bacterium]
MSASKSPRLGHRLRPPPPTTRPRFLAEADCQDIAQRLVRYAQGGGETEVHLVSRWTGNVRWARNRVSTTGEDRDNQIRVRRIIRGASSDNAITINDVSDAALVAAARRAERLAHLNYERVDADVESRPGSPLRFQDEPAAVPQLFVASTYQQDAGRRAEAARQLMRAATAAGMLSAGYIEVSVTSFAYITSWGYAQYYQYTWAQYSNTVRDPKGIGSGWAGVDWPDWSKIDGEQLSAIALDKCLKSRNPVAVEPGRYTTILEPQAVCDFVSLWGGASNREGSEIIKTETFHKSGQFEPPNLIDPSQLGLSRLGEKVIDERITISADPMDPELGFPPYSKRRYTIDDGQIYHPVTWIEQGVLKNLAYDRKYAVKELGRNTGLPAEGAFRMSVSGPTTSVEEMIATTKRGLLVTRFDQVQGPSGAAMLCRGYTRDGLWLIENGKISKSVKNMLFVESIVFALNNVEQLGVPQRAFHPEPGGIFAWGHIPQPVIVPPLKIRDFSFTALSDAI